MNKVEEKNIFNLFSNNELKIENLYKSFSIEFPDHKNLWSRLIAKKRYQVNILITLSLKLKNDSLFKANSHILQILNYINHFIDEQFKKLSSGSILTREALTVAMRLERSLKEKKSLSLFEPKHDEVFKIFKTINHIAEQNINLLNKTYNKFN